MERPLVSRNWVEGVTESVGSNMALASQLPRDNRRVQKLDINWTKLKLKFFEFGIDLDN